MSYIIEFLPDQKKCEAQRGQTVLDVARANGIPISYECDGKMTCGTCFVNIEKGLDQLTALSRRERDHLDRQKLPPDYRLSCQAQICGSVVVRIPNRKTA